MTLNEIIKTQLNNQLLKFSKINRKYRYCNFKSYQYCASCKVTKWQYCQQKLQFQSYQPINAVRWHFYFICSNNHQVIRWVISDNNNVTMGIIKN